MPAPESGSINRRNMLKTAGLAVGATALGALRPPAVHAAEDNTIRLALVGCGGRGTGAAADAMSSKVAPTKLVAMADVFENRLKDSHAGLKERFSTQVDVSDDHKFISFDGYKQAMDLLRPGDVVMLTTPPAFRWVQFKYAIEKGLNVFMEKPITVDGPSTKKMLKLGEESVAKNLKVGVGLMCRHSTARQELFDRIQNNELGELVVLRAYRMHGPVGHAFVEPRPKEISELMYQVREFHGFLWASGGCYSDFYIHNIDECCWMKNAWPIEAKTSGGRHYRGNYIDQNFDSYTTEYTFADGCKMYMEGRTMLGCYDKFASYVHGSKGCAIISEDGHWPAPVKIYSGQKMDKNRIAWEFPGKENNPYQLEWDHLIEAIIKDKPHNEVKRGAEASLVTSMGRMAGHTGQVVTYEEMLNCDHEFAPNVDQLKIDGPAPILADAHGKYPVPQPGLVTTREF